MAKIYIAFVDTPGLFAGIIRRVIRQKYIHVALSLDPFLEETYSIGRRHPSVPLIAGFEKEDKYKILRAFRMRTIWSAASSAARIRRRTLSGN